MFTFAFHRFISLSRQRNNNNKIPSILHNRNRNRKKQNYCSRMNWCSNNNNKQRKRDKNLKLNYRTNNSQTRDTLLSHKIVETTTKLCIFITVSIYFCIYVCFFIGFFCSHIAWKAPLHLYTLIFSRCNTM